MIKILLKTWLQLSLTIGNTKSGIYGNSVLSLKLFYKSVIIPKLKIKKLITNVRDKNCPQSHHLSEAVPIFAY